MRTSIRQSSGTAEQLPHAANRPSLLHMVNPEEVHAMRKALDTGMVPADFETKLSRLPSQGLLHQFVAETCRSFVKLLLADHLDAFHRMAPAERERLLRVLAYVRKDNDAIADYKPGGFQDDLQEVRAAASEFAPLLQSFKEWRLRHQVPELWNG